MILLTLALSGAISGHVLYDQEFKMALPPGIRARVEHVSGEVDAYRISDASGEEIAIIFAGGGAYDTTGYRRFCLNGHLAWWSDRGPSGRLVTGNPGFNSVSIEYMNLDTKQRVAVRTMIASLQFDQGKRCDHPHPRHP